MRHAEQHSQLPGGRPQAERRRGWEGQQGLQYWRCSLWLQALQTGLPVSALAGWGTSAVTKHLCSRKETSADWQLTRTLLASEAGVHIKVHAIVEAQLLDGWATEQAALHALNIHPFRTVQEPVMNQLQ